MDAPTLPVSREVRIAAGDARLAGDLCVPPDASGIVLFAHGSGSGRHSARNRRVAQHLQRQGMATLLFDLLTAAEDQRDARTREHRFDIPLLTRRMQDATEWVNRAPELRNLPVGYFGASTGSAAALIAAARLGDRIAAVVSRGGRPDLAGVAALAEVRAPTLLVVGGADAGVLELNEAAYDRLRCAKQLVVVPGATHLFEEQGAIGQVCEAAATWFSRHFARLREAA
jgi:putative phosphoribosyl transferase